MSDADVWTDIADFFVSQPSLEAILRFRLSPAVRKRASELLEKNRRDALTDDDREELDGFTQAELFMRLVKARARAAARG